MTEFKTVPVEPFMPVAMPSDDMVVIVDDNKRMTWGEVKNRKVVTAPTQVPSRTEAKLKQAIQALRLIGHTEPGYDGLSLSECVTTARQAIVALEGE